MMATFGAVTALPLEARDVDHDSKDKESNVIKSVKDFEVFLRGSAVQACKSSANQHWGEVMVHAFPDAVQGSLRNMGRDKQQAFKDLWTFVGSEFADTETIKDTSLPELFSTSGEFGKSEFIKALVGETRSGEVTWCLETSTRNSH
ncbi:hypothetical protein H0H93_007323 [Arthromyces matolae]|nr:hypothetical protein H0H93_007323 [Arthromyces matolae]